MYTYIDICIVDKTLKLLPLNILFFGSVNHTICVRTVVQWFRDTKNVQECL